MQFIKQRKPITFVIIGVILIMLLAVLITNSTMKEQKKLQEYIEPPTTESVSPTIDIKMETFYSETLRYKIDKPAEWIYIDENIAVENGGKFVNQIDGATFSLIGMDYWPEINNTSADSLAADLTELNGQLLSFYQEHAAYTCSYQIDNVVYTEHTAWDLTSVIRFSLTYPAEQIDYYQLVFNCIYNSFVWDPFNPIPEEFFMFYASFGDFEFALPVNWESYIDENGRLVSVSPSKSIMCCTVQDVEIALSEMTQESFYDWVVPENCQGTIIYFENKGNFLSGEIAYLNENNQEIHYVTNILNNNGFNYEFSLECLIENYTTDYNSYSIGTSLFRVFN